eukprot:662622-Prorocentrum_minimum.AAC.1
MLRKKFRVEECRVIGWRLESPLFEGKDVARGDGLRGARVDHRTFDSVRYREILRHMLLAPGDVQYT